MTLLLQTPFTMMCAGSTSTGKTNFVIQLIQNMDQMMLEEPRQVLFCYGSDQEAYKNLKENNHKVTFMEGLPTEQDIDNLGYNGLIVLDDLMNEVNNSTEMQKLFTQHSHHKKISVIFITQNVYFGGKHGKSINLNCHYLILFRNPNKLQIRNLGQQLFPGKHKKLLEAFDDATEDQYGYLLIDLHPRNDKDLMFRSKILPEQDMIVYLS